LFHKTILDIAHITKSTGMNNKRNIVAVTIIFVAIFIVFGKSLSHDFLIWDDGAFITNKDLIRSLSWQNILKMFTDSETSIIVPATWFSLAIDYHIYGMNPWGFILSNLILHALNVSLFYFLFQFFIDKRTHSASFYWLTAVIVSLIWGLHPLRVESVVWISERRDVLSVFFCLLSLLSYMNYARGISNKNYFLYRTKPILWQKHLSLLLFALALSAKPSVVPFPVILILLDFYPLSRIRISPNLIMDLIKSFSEKWMFFALSTTFAFLTLYFHHENDALKTINAFPIEQRLTNAVYSLSLYIKNTLSPIELLPFYHRQSLSILSPLAIATTILFIIIFYYCVKTAITKSRYWPIVAYMTYVTMLFPILGLFQGGQQGAGDRFTYLATIPFYLILGWCLLNLKRKKIIWIALVIYCPLLIAKTFKQQDVWKNNESFLSLMTNIAPRVFASNHNMLGLIHANRKEFDKAKEQFNLAMQSAGDAVKWAGASYGLGHIYLLEKNFDLAEKNLITSIEFDPNYYDAYYDLGNVYIFLNKKEDAKKALRRALEIKPENNKIINPLLDQLK
jgi:protein O-mannosyl-transferase